LALRLLARDLELAGHLDLPQLPAEMPDGETAYVCGDGLSLDKRVYLEDLDFKAIDNVEHVADWAKKIAAWVFPNDPAWQGEFKKRFAVLPDVVFDYLTETATEVVTRVRIDDVTKTVAEGQLWTEEALPAEAILAGLVACDRVYNGKGSITLQTLLDEYATNALTLQIGGKASVGRGRVRCLFTA
ncbi:MAG TPA: type III-B CRISPR module RAMP protein Cmr4, partial [Gemmataceae bacterium]|nr:type III-B CRISPR module RAMP protein Cmr4 [Gemmataceae bacterium]